VVLVVVVLPETISFFCAEVDVDAGVGVDGDGDGDGDASERCS
jgi:hypothetical protein